MAHSAWACRVAIPGITQTQAQEMLKELLGMGLQVVCEPGTLVFPFDDAREANKNKDRVKEAVMTVGKRVGYYE